MQAAEGRWAGAMVVRHVNSGWGWAAAGGRACWVPVGRRQGGNGEQGGRTRFLVPMRRARAMPDSGAALCRAAVAQRAAAQHVSRSLMLAQCRQRRDI